MKDSNWFIPAIITLCVGVATIVNQWLLHYAKIRLERENAGFPKRPSTFWRIAQFLYEQRIMIAVVIGAGFSFVGIVYVFHALTLLQNKAALTQVIGALASAGLFFLISMVQTLAVVIFVVTRAIQNVYNVLYEKHHDLEERVLGLDKHLEELKRKMPKIRIYKSDGSLEKETQPPAVMAEHKTLPD